MADAALVAGAPGVAAAREALLAWVDDAGTAGRRFLEVRLLATAGDRYEIRHATDAGRGLDELLAASDPYRAREIAQTTAAGEHRPLKTAPNLRRGWALSGLDGTEVWAALDYLYPAGAVHWYAGLAGSLRTTSWKDTAARQSGIYAAVGQLPPEAVDRTVAACCADAVCLRSVAWHPPAPERITDAADPEEARVPCPEACSMFVSFARAILAIEREPRAKLPGPGPLAPSEVGQLRTLAAAAAAGKIDPVREGEFSAPLNGRRLRYLALRMSSPAPLS